eukprot:4603003-Prymnesium_polylepis.1
MDGDEEELDEDQQLLWALQASLDGSPPDGAAPLMLDVSDALGAAATINRGDGAARPEATQAEAAQTDEGVAAACQHEGAMAAAEAAAELAAASAAVQEHPAAQPAAAA